MKVGQLSFEDLCLVAKSEGIRYRTGPVTACLKTKNTSLLETFQLIYPELPLYDENTLCQYQVNITTQFNPLHKFKHEAQFHIDGHIPFEPYPANQAFPLLEWGLNWCIGTSAHQYLLLHSAVVEKNGLCLILPAMPGSGKSTLSSALALSGWRLLSDEFGVIRHAQAHESYCEVVPLPRSIPLKNESIDIIRHFSDKAILGPTFLNTRKGDVAHLSPPENSIPKQHVRAKAKWLVFPKYGSGRQTKLISCNKSDAFTKLSNNSFNYRTTMEKGFRTLSTLIQSVDCYTLPNGDLQEAVDAINHLAETAFSEGEIHQEQLT